jgi:hypothetical protein
MVGDSLRGYCIEGILEEKYRKYKMEGRNLERVSRTEERLFPFL